CSSASAPPTSTTLTVCARCACAVVPLTRAAVSTAAVRTRNLDFMTFSLSFVYLVGRIRPKAVMRRQRRNTLRYCALRPCAPHAVFVKEARRHHLAAFDEARLVRPVVGDRVVDGAEVLPHQHVALLPAVHVAVLRRELVREQILEQRV